MASLAGPRQDSRWYWQRAEECEGLARLVSLKADKDRLRDMARNWREMAEQMDGAQAAQSHG